MLHVARVCAAPPLEPDGGTEVGERPPLATHGFEKSLEVSLDLPLIKRLSLGK